MTKIKLCGLTRPADIEAANELQPEFVGFVFAPASKRYIDPQEAAELRSQLDPGITAVGVFVDIDVRLISSLVEAGAIDWVQLHCAADAEQLETIRKATGAPIMQAFKVRTALEAETAARSSADYILFDAGYGDGKTFDWSMVRSVDRPFFLAGGLTPDNVGEAIRTVQPAAVDVSSGIEADGHKDADLMREFVAAARKESMT